MLSTQFSGVLTLVEIERFFMNNIFSIYFSILKTCLGRWTIGRSGERGSGISVLPARYDDDDDFSIFEVIFFQNKDRFTVLIYPLFYNDFRKKRFVFYNLNFNLFYSMTLSLTLKYIRWWGYLYRDLRRMKCPTLTLLPD